MGIRGEIFSTKVVLPNRTYFFNVKENRLGDLYLNMVESKNKDTNGFERQSLVLFAEDLSEFLRGFDEALKVLDKSQREKKKTGRRDYGSQLEQQDEWNRGQVKRYGREERESSKRSPHGFGRSERRWDDTSQGGFNEHERDRKYGGPDSNRDTWKGRDKDSSTARRSKKLLVVKRRNKKNEN